MATPDLIALFIVPLNQLGVSYMVTGAAAASVYGEPRFTRDIDVVVGFHRADAARIHASFDENAYYVPDEAVIADAITRASHFNVIHTATSLKADYYVVGNDPLHRWAMDRRQRHEIGGAEVFLAPPEYVILRKLIWFRDSGSERHLLDIRAMLRVRGKDLDGPALDRWIAHFGLESQWAQATAR